MKRFILVSAFLGLCLGACAIRGSVLQEKMTVLLDPSDEDDKRKVVVVTWKDEDRFQCRMFTDQQLIQEVLKSSGDANRVHLPSKDEMREIRAECQTLSLRRRRRRQAEEEESDDGWNVIFPGTKWCGAGDIAENDDDLGSAADTDRCCRAHDKCDDLIPAGETRHNLTNESRFTKLSCKCDKEFYDCLTQVNSLTSNTIGNTYFNLLRRPCYRKGYPKGKKCIKHTSMLNITCLEYERDFDSPPVYQWVKAMIYKQLPVPGPLDVKLSLSEEKTDILRKFLP